MDNAEVFILQDVEEIMLSQNRRYHYTSILVFSGLIRFKPHVQVSAGRNLTLIQKRRIVVACDVREPKTHIKSTFCYNNAKNPSKYLATVISYNSVQQKASRKSTGPDEVPVNYSRKEETGQLTGCTRYALDYGNQQIGLRTISVFIPIPKKVIKNYVQTTEQLH